MVSLLEMGIFFKKQRSAAAGIVLCTVEQIVVKEDVVRIRCDVQEVYFIIST